MAGIQQQENISVPHFTTRAMQRVLLLGESRRHVWRREQTAFEVVGPGVIRALNAFDEVTLRLFTDARPAMSADVEQRANLA